MPDTLVPCCAVCESLFGKVVITDSMLELKQDENLLECSSKERGKERGMEGVKGPSLETLGLTQL